MISAPVRFRNSLADTLVSALALVATPTGCVRGRTWRMTNARLPQALIAAASQRKRPPMSMPV